MGHRASRKRTQAQVVLAGGGRGACESGHAQNQVIPEYVLNIPKEFAGKGLQEFNVRGIAEQLPVFIDSHPARRPVIPQAIEYGARGQSLHFIESQTVRSVRSFLDHENQGLTLRDVSRFAGGRVVEATGPEGHQTDYIIDDETSRVTQLRFLTGGAKFDIFGNVYLAGEAYLFSDFRDVDGILTPFKVVRRIDAGGVSREFEEMVFTSVSHNTGVSDSEFRP